MTRLSTEKQDQKLGQKPTSFAQFMAEALYGQNGYYTQSVHIGGDGADFYTAALSPLFSFTIAQYVARIWDEFGQPEKLQIVELGAGQGELAERVREWLTEHRPSLQFEYVIVEVSPYLEGVQRERLAQRPGADQHGFNVRWGIPDSNLPTVLVANELLDALPVERIRRTKKGWEQAHVQRKQDGFEWLWKPAPENVAKLAAEYVACPIGTTAELCLEYPDFFQRLTMYGEPLRALFIDYGIGKAEWQAGVRPEGTLRAFHRHRVTDVLQTPGLVDLTADVNWDYATACAEQAGFRVEPLLTQAQFLMQFGILDVFQSLQQNLSALSELQKRAELTGQFKQLVYPGGMGERFSVMSCRFY